MKEKLKVYHGLPKTPITDATVLYSSLDGKTTPEIGSSSNVTKEFIPVPSVTGYAMRCKSHVNIAVKHLYTQKDINSNSYTIEYWMDMTNFNQSDLQASGSNFEQYGIYFANCSKSYDELRIMGIIFKPSQNKYYNWIRIYEGTTYEVQIPIELRLNHFRITRNNDTVKIYHNGKEYYSGTHSLSPIQGQYKIKFHDITVPICDLVVHDRDLGDYFPTLPQDYIDGKAIVVPALNQRQSYGDPVLHQVTELLVPAQSETELGKYYSTSVRDADGYEQCLESPELYAGNWHNWAQTYGKIRIKGLDNMTITGVLDTDTALAKIVKPSTGSTNILYLNTVDKLVVGDKIRVCDISTGVYYEHKELTVQSINTNEKSITISPSTDWILYPDKHFIFEITASSSSPVVKTVDGQVVNGTWEGLGTDTATFTMGANSGIAGKDLVVTYCLNAKGNASPYPKMPSEVIRGYDELGNELVPVSSISFKDDFRHKVQGNLNVCPHYASFRADTTLLMPNSFTPDSYIDYTTFYKQDGRVLSLSNTTNANNISQALFSFNVLSLLKTKIGKEDLTVQQAIDLIKTINFNVYGYGYGNDSNALKTTVFVADSNEWSNTVSTHTKSIVTPLLRSTNGIHNVIDSNGLTHFLVYTNTCGSTHSTLFLEYANIELVLKTEERFTYLALDMEDIDRSKECNPILIDKQTKEVKRLVPSTKPFSTEVIVHNPTTLSVSTSETILCQSPNGFVTTQGSGSSAPTTDVLRGLIGKLGLSSYRYTNEDVVKLPVTGFSQSTAKNTFVPRQFYPTQFGGYEPKELPDVRNSLFIAYDIISLDNTLYLKTSSYSLNDKKQSVAGVQKYYKIPNRPLIK